MKLHIFKSFSEYTGSIRYSAVEQKDLLDSPEYSYIAEVEIPDQSESDTAALAIAACDKREDQARQELHSALEQINVVRQKYMAIESK